MMSIPRHREGGNSLVSVFAVTGACVGFILARGKLGFEVTDRNGKPLGIYPSQRQAADALLQESAE